MMTESEAFEELINNKEYIASRPISERNELSVYKGRWLKGTLKNLDGILSKHGYIRVNQPKWIHKNKLK